MPGKDTIRCTGCKKVLFEAKLTDGEVSIKCKCGVMNTIKATPEPVQKNFVYNTPYQKRMELVTK